MPEANEQLRAARERTPSRRVPGAHMGRAELAEAVNALLWDTTGQRFELDARAVARWERGAVRWPGAHYRSALRHVLGAAGDAALGFRPTSTPAAPQAIAAYAEPSPQPWALAATLARSSADVVALDHLENAVHGLAEGYPHTAPAHMWPSVSALISHVNALLADPMPLRLRRRATVVMGVLTGLAGSLWTDLDRPHDAASYFDVAELAAREADTPDLAAWALATRSIATHHTGDHGQTRTLLARAGQRAAAESSPRRQAWIAALTARAAAATGDAQQAHRALDVAHRCLGLATEPGVGTDFFDAARLNGLVGSVYLALRDTTRPAPAIRDALTRRAPHDAKGRALLSLDMATCLVHDGEAREATRVAVGALESARGATVAPIVARARALRADLVRLSGPSGARELDACLREVVGG
ncbi:Putative C1 regulatory protein [Alloactinosynnema sp. L-07]|uniref:hypothetical protein n=1 Tax=Alloactinosynnema sp. L-07 TaxID=1653480 RepID=UPI00065EF625|nr:hypothetical protein [Alloactinosynnema sp. L-07]CRK61394.1 Putative C1 regulatory protein [Alloactinosynnema sp. L-07]